MSTVNRRHSVFVKEMILNGDQVKAYMKAYGCSKETARARSYKLLQNVTIRHKIEKARKEIEYAQFEAIKSHRIEDAIKRTIDVREADAVLSEIINGTLLSERKVIVFNKDKKMYETVLVKEPADHTARVAAVREFFKRKGAYAPRHIEIGVDDPLLELMKIVQTKSHKEKHGSGSGKK